MQNNHQEFMREAIRLSQDSIEKADAQNIGFDDSFIYDEIGQPINKRKVEFKQLLREEAMVTFNNWDSLDNKTESYHSFLS